MECDVDSDCRPNLDRNGAALFLKPRVHYFERVCAGTQEGKLIDAFTVGFGGVSRALGDVCDFDRRARDNGVRLINDYSR